MHCLVVDDDQTSALIVSSILKSNGYVAHIANDEKELFDQMQKSPVRLVFLDYRLGETDGLEVLQKLVKDSPHVKVVMITAHGSIELALEAMRIGASGFIAKPFTEETVMHEANRALKHLRYADFKNEGFEQSDEQLGGIVGSSEAVQRIHNQIAKMKDVETTVLVTGESGTGKELIARSLHSLSKRQNENFEAINCAAIPESLLEAELFGYKRGAFTDAKSDRKGLFETCNKGTLFLDEIGELPLKLQSKLLRVLQEKIITPLGSSQSISVGTRVVAATNRNLNWLVKEGKFRPDLYYRLSILQIESPPLRERVNDVPLLANFFVEKISKRHGIEVNPLSEDLLARLVAYEWPGNIRELQNSLERAIVLSENGNIAIGDIFSHHHDQLDDAEYSSFGLMKNLTEAKDEFEKKYLVKLLGATKGNVSQASKIAGRIRTDMYRLFSKYEIEPSQYKPH